MQCKPGESFPAADGCNTCTCGMDGVLGCTLLDCEPVCPPPIMKPNCEQVPTFVQDPTTGFCCEYATPCEAPTGWKRFDSSDACNGMGGGPTCEPNRADCDGDPANGCESDLTSPDNCGMCGQTCLAPDGQMGKCDQAKCVYASEPLTCLYQGVTYSVGASFPSRDGCNTCGCLDTGMSTEIACTDRACSCEPANEPFRNYVGGSADDCKAMDPYECPPNTTAFTNECGCGCEQSVECPIEYKCSPDGADMMCASLATRCPYTELNSGL
jgi:hypothetical protein